MTPPERVQCWHLQDRGTSKNQAWTRWPTNVSLKNQPPTCEQEGHFGRPLRLGRLPKKTRDLTRFRWMCGKVSIKHGRVYKEIDGFGMFWPIENGGCSLFFIWFWPIENSGFSYCQVGSYEVTQLWQKPLGSDDALAARKAPALVGVRTSAASADWKRSGKKKKNEILFGLGTSSSMGSIPPSSN